MDAVFTPEAQDKRERHRSRDSDGWIKIRGAGQSKYVPRKEAVSRGLYR